MLKRQINFYPDNQFITMSKYYEEKGVEIVPASLINATFIPEAIKNPTKYLIDISYWVEFLNKNRDRIHDMEGLMNRFVDENQFICSESTLPIVFDVFKYIFSSQKILDGCLIESQNSSDSKQKNGTKLITNLSNKELESFVNEISNNIVGHKKFKDGLLSKLKSFRLFNKLNEQKVFSIFLMGQSGIGKTEIGRQMHYALKSSKKLCKISFGNYSSKDSLNSLIGSPRGYTGSETGELPLKIKQSDTGIILIDEFEKADNPVFNFFLDLLEEGKFTDSQSNVYDLNGYVIIFTSNLTPEQYYKKLSPELRSRFDYVSQFNLLSDLDKKDYMYKRIENTIQKFEQTLNVEISKEDKKILYDIDYNKLNNLRKINRAIKDNFSKISNNYL